MSSKTPTMVGQRTPAVIFGRAIIYTILIIAAVYFLIPFFVMAITSIKTMLVPTESDPTEPKLRFPRGAKQDGLESL